MPYPLLSDHDWLREAYIGQGHSTLQIAVEVGCTATAVSYALHRHNIPVRSPSSNAVRHGYSGTHRGRGADRSPTYQCWVSMRQRCLNQNRPEYPDYGGRGITICDRWSGPDGFVNFLADMGERPEGFTLDRIDSDGNYKPGNCRWATRLQQRHNWRADARCKTKD